MRQLTRVERAAMWFYHNEYAAQSLSAIDFYQQLPYDKQALMQQMVDEILGVKTITPRRRG